MNRREYGERVLSVLRRTTATEREAIRAEIDAHIEDHMEALLELGWDEQLAEERTLAAMGEPEEVGRELDKQYSPFWLFVGNAASAALLVILIMSLMGVFSLHWVFKSFQARISPWENVHDRWEEEINLKLDIQQPIGSDILRVLGSGTYIEEEEDQPIAVVVFCQYDKNPFGWVTNKSLTYMDCRGEEAYGGGSGHSTAGASYGKRNLRVQKGDPCVTIVCERHGERIEIEVPLEWERAYE